MPLPRMFEMCLFSFLHLCKAFAAIYRTVFSRLKRYSCFLAASCTSSGEHFPFRLISRCILLCITAALATLRLIGEASFCVEFLFASSENEFIAAVLAYQSLIFVHSITLPFSRVSAWDSSCRNGLSGCSMKNVPAAGYRPENPGAITAKRLPNEVFVGHAAVHYPLILQRFRAVPQPVLRTLLRRSAC